MLGSIRRTIAVLRERQILQKLGIVISITIIATACYILYHSLQDLDFDDLMEALRDTDRRAIALAALCVAAGYFTLTFYDLFALRTIGAKADVPYRVAALAGFTSYSIGHNVGASVFTGGAVRYRIYSAWGLNAVDVAKLCFVAGLTLHGSGNAAVLGLGVLYHPEAAAAVDQLPPWFNRLAAIVILVALLGYVVWVWIDAAQRRPRHLDRGGCPAVRWTLPQIAIGIIDLGFCALAMFILLPEEPHVGFVVVAVIFVSATLLGFACRTRPAGLGVVRCRHAGRAVAVRQGRAPGGHVAVSCALLPGPIYPVRHAPGRFARSSWARATSAAGSSGRTRREVRSSDHRYCRTNEMRHLIRQAETATPD